MSAQIFPAPVNPPSAGLAFAVAAPGGGVAQVPFTSLTGSTYRAQYLPAAATPSVGPFSMTASWPGDETYSGATSEAVTFSVSKAAPQLTLTLNRSTALLNLANAPDFAATAALGVPGFPGALQSLLEGRDIFVSVALGNTFIGETSVPADASGVATFDKIMLANAGILFNQEGIWRFKAEFRGDTNLLGVATADFNTTTATLDIKRGAGYAIIVHGLLDPVMEGLREHAVTADMAYRSFIAREFNADDIYYLRQPAAGEPPSDIAAARNPSTNAQLVPTKANLLHAIEVWAKEKIEDSRAPLYLVLCGHGSPNRFHLDELGAGPLEFTSPSELATSLNLLDSQTDNPDTVFI